VSIQEEKEKRRKPAIHKRKEEGIGQVRHGSVRVMGRTKKNAGNKILSIQQGKGKSLESARNSLFRIGGACEGERRRKKKS